MKNPELKYVKGEYQCGAPADIYFYTDVDYWSVDDFLWEFEYLVNRVGCSKINIHINSAGGSVVDGMSVFSRIMDCKIPTACYNDGLAASMGSIIWAAGNEVYMKDYALLMIHNPFIDGDSGKTYNQVTEAFTQQLKTIYQKRFNLSEEEVESIMNGEEGNDGTFFTAAQALERGFVSTEHIIVTPEAVRGKVTEALKDGFNVERIKAVMNSIASIERKDRQDSKPNTSSNNNQMEKNEIAVFGAILGLTGEKATTENVSAQISELKAKADKLDKTKAELDEAMKNLATAQTELTGAQASVKNLTADLEKANASLKLYQDAEKAAKAKAINDLVEAAIKASKIDAEDKQVWVKMAENDFDTAQKVLDKIPGRQDISRQISSEGQSHAQAGMQSEEEKVKAHVDEVVGKDFQFRRLD